MLLCYFAALRETSAGNLLKIPYASSLSYASLRANPSHICRTIVGPS